MGNTKDTDAISVSPTVNVPIARDWENGFGDKTTTLKVVVDGLDENLMDFGI